MLPSRLTVEFPVSVAVSGRKLPKLVFRDVGFELIVAATGELQRLENLDSSDHFVELFMGIYGVGRATAVRWVTQGLKTLQDVLERGNVSESQRIGVELYDVCPFHCILISGLFKENTEGRS